MKGNGFIRFSFITLVAVYLLILIGGIVRATGSGMGCPDWPKCFGKLVPPTSVSQLPFNYKEIYAEKRKEKNLRIANLMEKLGYHSIHDAIIHDPSVYVEEDFNATKTWIEYINRLVGALIGLFILIAFILSFSYWKIDKSVVWLSFSAFILTLIQGFLGSIVVSTNLIPATITFHMLFALVMVGALVFALVKAAVYAGYKIPKSAKHKLPIGLMWLNLLLALVQVVLGTQVREAVDIIKDNNDVVQSWLLMLEKHTPWFEAHRIFAFVVLFSGALLSFKIKHIGAGKLLNFASTTALVVLGASILSGIVLAYVELPAFMQPIHLTLGSLLAGVYFAMLAYVYQVKRVNLVDSEIDTKTLSSTPL